MAVIDRLEKAGFARGDKDPHDRRKVIVVPVAEAAKSRIAPLFEAMGSAMEELGSRYSPEELALITDFVRRSNDITQAVTQELRTQGDGE